LSDNKTKFENEFVVASEDSTSKLVNGLKNLKIISNNNKILPDDVYDNTEPSYFYKNSASMDDAFEKYYGYI